MMIPITPVQLITFAATYTFEQSRYDVNEDDGTLTINVIRSGNGVGSLSSVGKSSIIHYIDYCLFSSALI